jgi:two-component system response regulator AtoC
MTELSIMIVEDDKLQRKALHDLLRKWGHDVSVYDCLTEARQKVVERPFDLILLDLRLPDGDGLSFLEELKKGDANRDAEVVVITAYSDVDSAVRSIKLGGYDYLTKPYEEEYLAKIVRNISSKVELSRRVCSLSQLTSSANEDVWKLDDMLGTEALRDVFETSQRVAETESTTVLILGETGTGKGMLAKAIHRMSRRRDKPFVDINCSAIPGQLLETELFGHEKGAFTDAKNARLGLMEVANGGTVFLDEIGDMPLGLQSKLLKVVEEKEFRRVGGVRATRVDVRIIAATCQDLQTLVKEGKFRSDLYYRLSVFPVTMPPLREHKNTIVPLASHYLVVAGRELGRKISGFTPEALRALQAYAWPGNVRELRNAVERAAILTTGEEIGIETLGLSGMCVPVPAADAPRSAPAEDAFRPMPLAESEKRLIENTLRAAGGNRNRAAEFLGIHRTTLYKKIAEYSLE